MKEITYEQAARALRCSPRHVRRVLRRNGVQPIVHGHRTIRFPLEKVLRLTIKLVRRDLMESANDRAGNNGDSTHNHTRQ